MLTPATLKAALHYDPETGVFTRRFSGRGRTLGEVAGCLHFSRNPIYRRIHVGGRRYYAHRLAWFYMTGAWPVVEIDHINGDGLDNRFCNLREATSSQNKANARITRNNKSGFKGAHWVPQEKRWRAQIGMNGRKIYLGQFTTAAAAHAAYVAAARQVFGEFARAA